MKRRHHRYGRVVGGGGGAVAAGVSSWNFLVDAAGGGDGTTIDGAIGTASVKTIWVKQGSYTETVTADVAGQLIYFEPGTTVTGVTTITAANVSWVIGTGCTFDNAASASALSIAVSGEDCHISICNGGIIGNMDCLTGADKCFIDGGGWGTIIESLQFDNSDDSMFQNSAVDSKTPAAELVGIQTTEDTLRAHISHIKVIDADVAAFGMLSGGVLLLGNTVVDCDKEAIVCGKSQTLVVGNQVIAGSQDGLRFKGGGDNSVGVGNNIKDHGAPGVDIDASAENCVIVGNRVDDLGTSNGIVDSSSTSTVGANDETAF